MLAVARLACAMLAALLAAPADAVTPQEPAGPITSASQQSAQLQALIQAGIAHERAGDLAAAAEAYRKALQLAPKSAVAHDRLGFTLGQQGDTEGAVEECRKAVALDPRLC